MVTLESERLILRQFRENDLDTFYHFSADPKVGPNSGWKPHESRSESNQILKAYILGGDMWAVTEKLTGHLIGSIGFRNDEKRAAPGVKSLGYALAEEHWGFGYGTEASMRIIKYGFEELDLKLISIYHFPFNYRSRRVIEKCGFTYEGTLKMAGVSYDQSVHDEVCYSMTRADYIELKTRHLFSEKERSF